MLNRKGAKDAKKKYNLSIAGFTPIKQKRYNGAGSNRKGFLPGGKFFNPDRDCKFKLCGMAQ